jgi:hypothetical protein
MIERLAKSGKRARRVLGHVAMGALLVVAAHPVMLSLNQPRNESWKVSDLPEPPQALGATASGLACGSKALCISVGDYIEVHGSVVTTEMDSDVWRGRGWNVNPVPIPEGLTASGLHGVSCPTQRTCIAVGWRTTNSGRLLPLGEIWSDGRWTPQSGPQLPRNESAGLNGVSCVSAWQCVAVGFWLRRNEHGFDLITVWNGNSWSTVSMPRAKDQSGQLDSVACPSAAWCIAVGSGGESYRLVRSGSNWRVDTASLGFEKGSSIEYSAITCRVVRTCFLVGTRETRRGGLEGFIRRRRRGMWIAEGAHGTVLARGDQLTTVDCVSAKDCLALGQVDGRQSLVIETWNGRWWRLRIRKEETPHVAIACPSRLRCWTVGQLGSVAQTALVVR